MFCSIDANAGSVYNEINIGTMGRNGLQLKGGCEGKMGETKKPRDEFRFAER